jgi:hypothetical protein
MRSGIRSLIITGIAAGFVLPAFASGGQPQPLRQSVALPAEQVPLSQYLLDIFKSAKIFGGVVITAEKCEEMPEEFPEFSGTVEGILKRLSANGHQLDWSQSGRHLVVRNTPSTPPVLKVQVHEFRFSAKEPLTKVSSNLFGTVEVQHETQALHLVEYGPELGFAQVHQPNTPEDMITLSNVTVLDALNAIAGSHAVWLYKQSSCARTLMSLNWPIR